MENSICENIQNLIEAIPGLAPEIADHLLSCRFSGRAGYHINQHSFRVLNQQLSRTFLENTDPSIFLAGVGIRLAISTQVIVSTMNFQNAYCVMEDLHHTVRGADISEFSVMGVLVKLALHAVKQDNCASKESIGFTKLCIARLDIPDMFAPVCTATEHICNYGERRLSGANHEVACGLVLPRQVQATFFLQDLYFLLKEIRRVCRVCFDSSRSALQTILLSYHETIPTLIGEWLSQKLDPIQFGQTYQLYSLLGLFFMLLGHLRNGNLDSFQYTFDIAIRSADDVLGEIKDELGTSMLYGKLSWDGATYASVTFGACLDDLRKQLLHLQEHAG